MLPSLTSLTGLVEQDLSSLPAVLQQGKVLLVVGTILVVCSISGLVAKLWIASRSGSEALVEMPQSHRAPSDLSILTIAAITSYKFYVGFLGSTWVPFLIAMEGKSLMPARQSLFMGLEKLVYGFSICLNPLLGLMSDRLALQVPRYGRAVFAMSGLKLASMGILATRFASHVGATPLYLAVSGLWMFGEALIDVTTESLVPEFVPLRQFDMASSIRALHFLAGGIAGYASLYIMAGKGCVWLYYTYLVLMVVSALPSLACGVRLAASQQRQASAAPVFSCATFVNAYLTPMRYSGSFPRACLCVFTFGLGTGPIFFTLLMVRDLVGISDAREQQLQFSGSSILFLVSAAVSSVLASRGGGIDSGAPHGAPAERPQVGAASSSVVASGAGDSDAMIPEGPSVDRPRMEEVAHSGSLADATSAQAPSPGPDAGAGAPSGVSGVPDEVHVARFQPMLLSVVAFGFVCLLVPLISIPKRVDARLACLYYIAASFGATFGQVSARFKACLWGLLPPGANVGNAMGFAALAQMTGIGIGSFIAGVCLDRFKIGGQERYSPLAYYVMTWGCATCEMLTATLIAGILRQKQPVLR